MYAAPGHPGREACERRECSRAHSGHARPRSRRGLGRPSPRWPGRPELAPAAGGRTARLVRRGHAGQPALR